MKRYLKIAALVTAVLMALSCFAGCGDKKDNENSGSQTSSTAKQKLIVGTNAEFSPFEYIENDKFVGIDMDIMRAIADKLDMEIEIKNMDFEALPNALDIQTISCIAAGLTANPDRAESMDFSDTYYNASQSIIVPADSTIATKEDLKGKSVGGQTGTTGLTVAAEICGEQNVRGYNNAMLAVQDLVNGNLDAVVIDNAPAKVLANKYSTTKLIDGQFDAEEYVLAVKKGDSELLGKINGALKELMASGKVDEIISNYIDDQGDQSVDADVAPEK